MCSNIGTLNNHHFPFGTNGEVVVLGVPILKHFRVFSILAISCLLFPDAKALQFDWTSVQSWQLVRDKEVIKYTVSADDKIHLISCQTDRVLYLLAITKEMINQLQVMMTAN